METGCDAHFSRSSRYAYWRRVVDEWDRGEERSQSAFCQRMGVSVKSFRRWRDRLASEKRPAVRFAKVEVAKPVESGVRIALAAGSHIEISPDFDEATLRRVLAVCR